MTGVKEALDSRGMTVEAAQQGAKERKRNWDNFWAYVDDWVRYGKFCLIAVFFRNALLRFGYIKTLIHKQSLGNL